MLYIMINLVQVYAERKLGYLCSIFIYLFICVVNLTTYEKKTHRIKTFSEQ